MNKYKKGDLVRSIINPHAPLFRVVAAGPKRLRLFSVEGSFFACYCHPSDVKPCAA